MPVLSWLLFRSLPEPAVPNFPAQHGGNTLAETASPPEGVGRVTPEDG